MKSTKKWSGGGIPYGYRFDPETKSLQINSDEAAILNRIFIAAANGEGSKYICNLLNSEKLQTRFGKKWNITLVSGILFPSRLQFYRGLDEDDLRGDWERLLTEQQYKSILKHKPQLVKRLMSDAPVRTPNENYLLSGLGILKCGYCSGTVKVVHVVKPNKTRFFYYLCTSRQTGGESLCKNSKLVNMESIDTIVLTELKVQTSRTAVIAKLIEKKKDQYNKLIQERANHLSKTLNDANSPKFFAALEADQKIINELKKESDALISPTPLSGRTKQKSVIANIAKITLYVDKIEIEFKYPINDKLEFHKTIALEQK